MGEKINGKRANSVWNSSLSYLTSEHVQETEGKALETLAGLSDAGCHSFTQGTL